MQMRESNHEKDYLLTNQYLVVSVCTHNHHHHHVSSFISERIRPLTSLLQSALSPAAATASIQVARPIFCLSHSTILLHISLDQPLLLLPSGAHATCRAMRGFCWWSIHNTCPIQVHLHSLICSLMVQFLALHLTSSLVTLIGQLSLTPSVGACGGMCLTLLILLGHSPSFASVEQHCYDVKLKYPDLGVLTQLATSPHLVIPKCCCSFS